MLTSSLIQHVVLNTHVKEKNEIPFTSVSTDTRTLTKGALFVPLIGEHFNGHRFITEAVAKGAKAALWQKDEPIPATLPAGFQLYFVQNTLTALQQMAKVYREKVNPIVIGITGSNGKTTTKDILYAILSRCGNTYKTKGNYNNHIGLPLTLLQMPSTCEYVILEMGMSGFGEIALLSELALPHMAIITNIGESHLMHLKNRERIAKAKMEIRQGLKEDGLLIVDGDEPLLHPYDDRRTVTVGFSPKCDAIVSNVKANEEGYSFTYESNEYTISLLGKHNVKNASYCITVARKLGIKRAQITKGLKDISLSGMRLEKEKGIAGELIINDAYNASPASMVAALDTVKSLPHFSKRIAVLGDMYELGEHEEKFHRQLITQLKAPLTDVVLIGENMRWLADEWERKTNKHISLFYTTCKKEGAKYIRSIISEDAVVLFKASRGMQFEEVIKDYQQIEKEGK